MVRELERSGYKDRPISRAESRAARGFRQQGAEIDALKGTLFEGAVLLEDISLSTTPASFNHGLGSAPRGAFIVKQGSAFDLIQADAANPAEHIMLSVASGSGTVSVVVF